MDKKIIIAIDGHSSCGKSTLAKQLAAKLCYKYIDTGAMYRAVTFYALQNNLFHNKEPLVNKLLNNLESISITFSTNSEGKNITWLNGKNVESEIRKLEVADNVSSIARIAGIRKKLVQKQQEMGKDKGIVMDGRDIGTVVFKNAELKIFMTASPEVRAERRYKEMIANNENVQFNAVLDNVKKRDFIDENRDESPLKKANDAFVIDNSKLTLDEQFRIALNKALEIIEQ